MSACVPTAFGDRRKARALGAMMGMSRGRPKCVAGATNAASPRGSRVQEVTKYCTSVPHYVLTSSQFFPTPKANAGSRPVLNFPRLTQGGRSRVVGGGG